MGLNSDFTAEAHTAPDVLIERSRTSKLVQATSDGDVVTAGTEYDTVLHSAWLRREPAEQNSLTTSGIIMTVRAEPIVVEQFYKVPIQVVWKAITDKDQMRRWYFEPMADLRPEVGFETKLTVQFESQQYVRR